MLHSNITKMLFSVALYCNFCCSQNVKIFPRLHNNTAMTMTTVTKTICLSLFVVFFAFFVFSLCLLVGQSRCMEQSFWDCSQCRPFTNAARLKFPARRLLTESTKMASAGVFVFISIRCSGPGHCLSGYRAVMLCCSRIYVRRRPYQLIRIVAVAVRSFTKVFQENCS